MINLKLKQLILLVFPAVLFNSKSLLAQTHLKSQLTKPQLKKHQSSKLQTNLTQTKKESKPNWLVCEGPLPLQNFQGRSMDSGRVKMHFLISSISEIRSIKINTTFRKVTSQNIEVDNARAITDGLLRSPSSLGEFYLGNNGACEFALAYNRGAKFVKSNSWNQWAYLKMSCGALGAQSKLSCQVR